MVIGVWYSYGILCNCVDRRILKEQSSTTGVGLRHVLLTKQCTGKQLQHLQTRKRARAVGARFHPLPERICVLMSKAATSRVIVASVLSPPCSSPLYVPKLSPGWGKDPKNGVEGLNVDGVREDVEDDELYVSAGDGMRNGESAGGLCRCINLTSEGSESISRLMGSSLEGTPTLSFPTIPVPE